MANGASATNPLGHTTHYTYDGLGNQTSRTDALGNVFRSRVNALGLLVASEMPQPDGTTATERYWYDNAGNLTLVQDAEGGETHYRYDERGNLLEASQPVSPTETFTTSYTYDREGRLLTSETDDAVHTYAYDALGNLVLETDALGQSSTYSYDALGNLTASVNRNGVETTFAYDALSREVLRHNSQDGQASGTVNTYSMGGLLLESANSEEAYTYQYDAFGRVTEVIATGLRKVYTYDKGDRVTNLKVYQGSVLEMDLAYEYDAAGQLTAVISDGVRTTYSYDAAGRLSVEQNGLTGIQTHYFYTPSGLLSAVIASGGGEILKAYAYEYDRNGNQTLKIEDGRETRYYYDAVGRLETAELPDGTIQHFAYDKRGNRVEMAEIQESFIRVTTYGYDRNNRLLYSENDVEAYRYEYDPQGNQTKRIYQDIANSGTASQETEFLWNGAGLLAYSIDPSGLISSYAYGPDGLRTSKTVGEEETHYFYESGSILLELNGDSRITAKTTRGLRLISRETLTEEYGYLLDGHGDVTALIGADGRILLDYEYDPFGNETSFQPDETTQLNNPFRYCGEYWDAETQTYYLRARQYDPATGRFLSEDTHWNPGNMAADRSSVLQSTNLYLYCGNNPIMLHDPSGNVWESVFDALSFMASFKDMWEDPSWENLAYLGWDTLALAAPVVPGSYAVKGLKALDNLDDVGDTVRSVKGIKSGLKFHADFDESKVMRHIFTDKHKENGLLKLGSGERDIYNKILNKVKLASNEFVEGPNNIRASINDEIVTIRVQVKDGAILNINAFMGESNRQVVNMIDLAD